MEKISAHIIDVLNRRLYDGVITVDNGKIVSIDGSVDVPANAPCIMPGFVDAHVHIESSMLLPEEFGKVALRHGTVAAVCDPHEISNVLGVEGISFMIENSRKSSMKFCFAAPSCVPSTVFETAGAAIDAVAIGELMQDHDIYALGEMMNSVGVISDDPEVMGKIKAASDAGKPIDGHAPLLSGDPLRKYAAAGITTDHECTSVREAEEKLACGMSILLRSGSAANDFIGLMPLLEQHGEKLMFCSDDKHPDDLLSGHINIMVRNAVASGYPLWNILNAACVQPVKHYRLPVGLLQPGDNADFIVVDNATDFNVIQTYIGGMPQINQNKAPIHIEQTKKSIYPNRFLCTRLAESDIYVPYTGGLLRVIEAESNSIITGHCTVEPLVRDMRVQPDTDRDILKIVVANRYSDTASPQVAFISGFGLKSGAIASTIAHDCHNLIAVGTDDRFIVAALNRLVAERGGIAVCDGNGTVDCLPLPVAGLMSPLSAEDVSAAYQRLNIAVRGLGSPLNAPFMTLSFMALPVIPNLKLTDKGLFDFATFNFIDLFSK